MGGGERERERERERETHTHTHTHTHTRARARARARARVHNAYHPSPLTCGITFSTSQSPDQVNSCLPCETITQSSARRCCRVQDGASDSLVSASALDGIAALGKAHARSAPSLSNLATIALETVPMLVWLNSNCSRPQRVKRRPLPFSGPLSFKR